MFAPPGPPKPAEALESYAASGSGTVQGAKDREKEIQIEFWERAAREGFTDERARASAQKFRTEFEALDKRLAQHPYLMGDNLSVLDIAWFIYAHRLSLAGYPFARLHPRLDAFVKKCARSRNSARRSQHRQSSMHASLSHVRRRRRLAKPWRLWRACKSARLRRL